MKARLLAAFAVLQVFAGTQAALAQEKVRIGIIAPFSGPFATVGTQMRQGIDAYVALHGTRAGNRDIELLFRDHGTTNPAYAKQLAEELIVREKVSLIGGLHLSPEVSAMASVATETRTPTVMFIAGGRQLTKQSPYLVRTGSTLWQEYLPAAEWVYMQGKRRAYIAVADYSPGHDAQEAFKSKFTELGGQIVGEARIPLNTVDFAPFVERIARAKPEVVNIFIPPGAPALAFIKALAAQNVLGQGIMVIGCPETDDPDLKLYDDSVVGVYSSLYYAIGIPGEANRKFKEAVKAKFDDAAVPNFSMAAAYDGMHLLYRMVEAQKGSRFDPDAALAAVKGYSWESPRGPLKVEDNREMTLNMYIRQVQKVDGRLQNVLIDTVRAVKAE
jgi:branched-chain amino acid transport system substrate-binding protein